jgi:formiminoglutamase
MSGASSNAGAWSSRLEPARPPELAVHRDDDPRLGEFVDFWKGGPAALKPGRAVIIGFPQDEGVQRNQGRAGAAEAPDAIRHWLYRLTPCDVPSSIDLADQPPLDLGNVIIAGNLEQSQHDLADVVAAVLQAGAVPVILGGGHETAYGHYLGYVAAGRKVGIVNLDAHLDVRPIHEQGGHSGSPFRQALENPEHPLTGSHYVCIGAQPHAVSREHVRYLRQRGGTVRWFAEVAGTLVRHLEAVSQRLADEGCQVYVSVDADSVQAADVPGVSAPNPLGLRGQEVIAAARHAGAAPRVASFDVVEINPRLDHDGRSARWAALAVWHFLIGQASRTS